MRNSRQTFEAKYPGKCTECGEEFEEGDDIGYYDGAIACGNCWIVLTDDGADYSDDY